VVILEFRPLMKEFSFSRRRGGSVVRRDNRSSGMDTLRRFAGVVGSGGASSVVGWSAERTRMGPPPSSMQDGEGALQRRSHLRAGFYVILCA
jgi:hypothetical protein